jgi:hypothetical protein
VARVNQSQLVSNSPSLRSIDGDKIGFFFGAGASIEFGIPSMKQITTNFGKIMNEEGVSKEKQTFDLIYNSLAKVYGEDKVDLEAIISVIAGLREKEQFKENIGDLALFLLEMKESLHWINEFEYDIDVLNNLEDKFKQYIRKVVIPNSQKIDLARSVYHNFFKHICEITNCANVNYDDSNRYKYTHDKWTFITTNYDNVIEDYWVSERGYSDLYLGFEKLERKVMNADKFLHNNTKDAHPYNAMQLVKLHGSVNWIKNKYGEIEEREYNTSLDDIKSRSGTMDVQEGIMIYPLSQKQLYFIPFIQLFRILSAELSKREFWIVIGYSFRDVIIRTMFEKALIENNRRKLLLVHPHASKEVRPLFKERLRKQLACLDNYFGRESYCDVNKHIAETLLNLADSHV